MSNSTHYALHVIRVEDIPAVSRVKALYVEVELDKIVRKTGTLSNDGTPGWNDILPFSLSNASVVLNVQLKEARKLGPDNLLGRVSIGFGDLLQDSARAQDVKLEFSSPPSRFAPQGRRPTSPGGIRIHLKGVDILYLVEIEIGLAEGNTEHIKKQQKQHLVVVESIGLFVDAADKIFDAVDKVPGVTSIVNLAWKSTSALWKLVSDQYKNDKDLVELVERMKAAYDFSGKASGLDDSRDDVKPVLKELLRVTFECSRFVQEYAEKSFSNRMFRGHSHQLIKDYKDQFMRLRGDLDTAIAMKTDRTATTIHQEQQTDRVLAQDTNAKVADIHRDQQKDRLVARNTNDKVTDMESQKQLDRILGPFESTPDMSRRPRCIDGTREEYMASIMDFLSGIEEESNILWLSGAAGTGKSTIAMTISDACGARGWPLVHLFFERGRNEHSTIVRFIAYKLACLLPSIATHIVKATRDDSNIKDRESKKQFEKLLLDPLRDSSEKETLDRPIIIILDALDECGSAEQRQDILQILKEGILELPRKVRILVTSRPEDDIKVCLSSGSHVERLNLTGEPDINKRDVSLYIRTRMYKFKNTFEDWDRKIQVLCDAADGLFIWASTAVKMVFDEVEPELAFRDLVGNAQSLGGRGLDGLYESVLEGSKIWRSASKSKAAEILGLILFAREPMTGVDIRAFLGHGEHTVDRILGRLQSVISYEPGKPVRLHHASFADYLLSPERSGSKPWHIDGGEKKHFMAERCFVVMEENLSFNICDIESSFRPNSQISDLQERIEGNIPSHLDYACRFWSGHMSELERPGSDRQNSIRDKLDFFAKAHLLHWLEVLSLTGCFIRVAARALDDAGSWIESSDAELSSFLWSAYRLVKEFKVPIAESAPHIYLSAISFWKGEAAVANHYSKTHPVVEVRRLGRRAPVQCLRVESREKVVSMAISPDGRLIASIYEDDAIRFWRIRVWDTNKGEFISSNFKMDGSGAVAFSSDCEYLVSCSNSGQHCTWEVSSSKLISELRTEAVSPEVTSRWPTTSVAFSANGKRVFSTSRRKRLYAFDFDEGRLTRTPDWFEDSVNVNFRTVSTNGKYVAGIKNRMIGIWDCDTGLRIFHRKADTVVLLSWSIVVAPDGKRIVTGAEDGIRIWNTDNGELVKGSPYEIRHVTSPAFSSDGKQIVAGSRSDHIKRKIVILNADNGDLVWGPIEGHTDKVTSVILAPDGKRLISGSYEGDIRIWDVDNVQADSGSFDAHTDRVLSVAFSPDGKRVVSGSWDNTVRIWDADSGKLLAGPFEGHTCYVSSVAFSPDGKRVVSGADDVQIWDVNSGKLALDPLHGHSSHVRSVAFSTDGKRIVSGSSDKTIFIWDANSGALIKGPLKVHTSSVSSVSFSPDNKRIVSGSDDETVCVWDAGTGGLIRGPLKGHTSSVNSVTFSPDGKRIASGSYDRTIRIWDADCGELASQFKGHTDGITSISYSSDGKLIASCSWDKTVCIWDVDNGKLILGPLEGHTVWVKSVSFSPAGNRIVSGSDDKTIRVWDVSIDRPIPEDGGECAKGGLTTSADTDTLFHDQNSRPNRPKAHAFSNWTLHDDGWIRGEGGELLAWIPKDMRDTLWRARNTAVFSCKFSAKLDFLRSRLGENWAEGYPKSSSVLTVSTL